MARLSTHKSKELCHCEKIIMTTFTSKWFKPVYRNLIFHSNTIKRELLKGILRKGFGLREGSLACQLQPQFIPAASPAPRTPGPVRGRGRCTSAGGGWRGCVVGSTGQPLRVGE